MTNVLTLEEKAAKRKGLFDLGRTVTYVCWRKNNTESGIDIEHWAAKDEPDALQFAAETSLSNNVDFTVFFGRKNKHPQFFVDGKKAHLSVL